jgi:DNA-binding helix-hairpin-helix protein with protein kinase domain
MGKQNRTTQGRVLRVTTSCGCASHVADKKLEALYVDANGNMFRAKGKTWASALEALHQNLKQQGISLRDLPQPRKGETIHV